MKAFANFHPLVLFIYFLSEIGITMFVSNPVIQILALLGGISFCALLSDKSKALGNIGFYAALFFMVAITNPLFSHNGVTPLFFLNGNPITLEAVVYGFSIAVMVIAAMIWCRCYSLIMTTDKFLCIFGKTVPKLSLVLSIALRFIPMFRRQTHKVSRAQKTMGLYSSKSYLDRVKSAVCVFSAMISWSLENAMETSASMKARGYGIKGRTNFSLFRFYKADAALLAICVFLFAITVVGAATGNIEFYFYPRISEIKLSLSKLAVYAAFGALSFLPFIIEVWERIKWKYCISKI